MMDEIEYKKAILDDVQMNKIFPDGKTFVDCVPKFALQEISLKYAEIKDKPEFKLKEFVLQNYDLPVPLADGYNSDLSKPVADNIEILWDVLTRKPDNKGGSIIALPYPYIVPGGRFGEIYYWDSYFTMLGLKVSGKVNMIKNMISNFSYLIEEYGYIPNGNRTYFLGRSQPPFYALMIRLLADEKDDTVLTDHIPQLKKEYDFWMKGSTDLGLAKQSLHRTVLMPDGELLNRYWDENETPRPESYCEDIELAKISGVNKTEIFRHLRAGAESGWDYSCRWFRDSKSFDTIHTTDIIPVDLNCLLVNLEETLAEAYRGKQDEAAAIQFELAAEKRRLAIQKYCWNREKNFYFDYDFKVEKQKTVFSLAAAYPLFFNISSKEQAAKVAVVIEKKFLHTGGLLTSTETTGQQWDAPNGWAPLHWITINGLENYGQKKLACEIAKRWIKLCTDVFRRTGKLMEKYNVVDTHLEAGGGEYPGQDGFGWTNGVLLALINKYN